MKVQGVQQPLLGEGNAEESEAGDATSSKCKRETGTKDETQRVNAMYRG